MRPAANEADETNCDVTAVPAMLDGVSAVVISEGSLCKLLAMRIPPPPITLAPLLLVFVVPAEAALLAFNNAVALLPPLSAVDRAVAAEVFTPTAEFGGIVKSFGPLLLPPPPPTPTAAPTTPPTLLLKGAIVVANETDGATDDGVLKAVLFALLLLLLLTAAATAKGLLTSDVGVVTPTLFVQSTAKAQNEHVEGGEQENSSTNHKQLHYDEFCVGRCFVCTKRGGKDSKEQKQKLVILK